MYFGFSDIHIFAKKTYFLMQHFIGWFRLSYRMRIKDYV